MSLRPLADALRLTDARCNASVSGRFKISRGCKSNASVSGRFNIIAGAKVHPEPYRFQAPLPSFRRLEENL